MYSLACYITTKTGGPQNTVTPAHRTYFAATGTRPNIPGLSRPFRCHGDLVSPQIWYPRYQITGLPSVSTRLGRFGPPIEVICLLWSTNVDKSSSIWLPRSRYCRTIQKNTCAAIVGRCRGILGTPCFGDPGSPIYR